MKLALLILAITLISCKSSGDSTSAKTLVGQWRIDKIVSSDSTWSDVKRAEYNSIPYEGGSRFYKAKELNKTITLIDGGKLQTKLMFTTFGEPTWTTNETMDSLILKLANVKEESLIADGTVDKNGDIYLYEGQVKFIDDNNLEWALSDGRAFTLKKENAN